MCNKELVSFKGNPYFQYGLGPICGKKTIDNNSPDSFKTFEHKDFQNNTTKKQHYNAANFIGNFSLNPEESLRESKLDILFKDGQLNIGQKAEKVGFEENIYSFNTYHQATTPDFLEKHIMTPIDKAYKELYRDLIKNNLSRKQKTDLIVYLLSLKFRHPQFLNYIRTGLNTMSDNLAKSSHNHKYEDDEQKKLGELYNGIIMKNYENLLYIQQIMDSKNFSMYETFNLKVVDNSSGVDLCIGDQPTISMTPGGEYLPEDGGLKYPLTKVGFMLIPISRTKLLVLSCLKDIPDEISDPTIINQINSFQYKQSESWFGMPKALGKNKQAIEKTPLLNMNSSKDMEGLNLFFRKGQDFNYDFYSDWQRVRTFVHKANQMGIDPNNLIIEHPAHVQVVDKYCQAYNLYKKESDLGHILRAHDIINKTNVCSKMDLNELSKIESSIMMVKPKK